MSRRKQGCPSEEINLRLHSNGYTQTNPILELVCVSAVREVGAPVAGAPRLLDNFLLSCPGREPDCSVFGFDRSDHR
ncbi:MAG: hypothetical protein WB791_04770 [Waddliaceae bacterium]